VSRGHRAPRGTHHPARTGEQYARRHVPVSIPRRLGAGHGDPLVCSAHLSSIRGAKRVSGAHHPVRSWRVCRALRYSRLRCHLARREGPARARLPIDDVALIAARRADYHGNLEYALTARNFNPLMAMAAALTIAEAEDIVPVGSISPDAVVTPGMVVSLLVSRGRDA